MSRRVIFAEVPCFYAMVEIAQDPALAGRAVIVGGDPRKRGLVQSASPEALATGVEPEMPVIEALRLCPTARTIRTNVRLYRESSRRLLACMRLEAGRLEPFGLGAAFFEAAPSTDPVELARRLRSRVWEELRLPLRVGIATGKFVARLAAEDSGDAGVRSIAAGGERAFLAPLPAGRLEGVGRKTSATLAELGAHTIGDVAALGRDRLEEVFGTHGLRIHALATALDDAPVRAARHPQSLTREVTVRSEARDRGILIEHVNDLVRALVEELRRQALTAAQVALKLRYEDQVLSTRSAALRTPTAEAAEIVGAVSGLLDRTQAGSRAVRTIGVQVSRLAPAGEADRQLDLFPRG